jgi:hypothetical protein
MGPEPSLHQSASHGLTQLSVMLIPAIRFVAAKGSKTWGGSIQLRCHVKPGVNVNREGIRSVTDEHIEVCVAAQVNEGEANKAVTKVIADVRR